MHARVARAVQRLYPDDVTALAHHYARAASADTAQAAFAAWTEPTPWQTRPYGFVDEQAVTTLERQLRRDDLDQVTRCRLLTAFVAELGGEDDPRPVRGATEALVIARELDDPDLLALALTAGTTTVDFEQEPERRAALAAELAALGQQHDLLEYEWYAGYVADTVAAVREKGLLSCGATCEPGSTSRTSTGWPSRRPYSSAAIAVADRAEAELLAADLARTPRLLAGAASVSLAMQPAALTLGELMAFLGAAGRKRPGISPSPTQVAVRWNSPQWTARALAAL